MRDQLHYTAARDIRGQRRCHQHCTSATGHSTARQSLCAALVCADCRARLCCNARHCRDWHRDTKRVQMRGKQHTHMLTTSHLCNAACLLRPRNPVLIVSIVTVLTLTWHQSAGARRGSAASSGSRDATCVLRFRHHVSAYSSGKATYALWCTQHLQPWQHAHPHVLPATFLPSKLAPQGTTASLEWGLRNTGLLPATVRVSMAPCDAFELSGGERHIVLAPAEVQRLSVVFRPAAAGRSTHKVAMRHLDACMLPSLVC